MSWPNKSETERGLLQILLSLCFSFYGNILKHFARSLRVSVSGRGPAECEVVVTHGLVCRRTGAWYGVDQAGVELATTLASHVAAVQPGVAGPYGARYCTCIQLIKILKAYVTFLGLTPISNVYHPLAAGRAATP